MPLRASREFHQGLQRGLGLAGAQGLPYIGATIDHVAAYGVESLRETCRVIERLMVWGGLGLVHALFLQFGVATVKCGVGAARYGVIMAGSWQLKALVWFWIIDETLVLTSILSVCRLNEVGTYQVMEQEMIIVMMVMTTR